jgi:hypothetical protein
VLCIRQGLEKKNGVRNKATIYRDFRQVSDSVRIVTVLGVATIHARVIKMCLNENYVNIHWDKYFYFIFLIRNDLKKGDSCYEGKYRKVFGHYEEGWSRGAW